MSYEGGRNNVPPRRHSLSAASPAGGASAFFRVKNVWRASVVRVREIIRGAVNKVHPNYRAPLAVAGFFLAVFVIILAGYGIRSGGLKREEFNGAFEAFLRERVRRQPRGG